MKDSDNNDSLFRQFHLQSGQEIDVQRASNRDKSRAAASNNLVFDNRQLSKNHSRLKFGEDECVYIKDLGSSFGTILNGEFLKPDKYHVLCDEDEVGFIIAKNYDSMISVVGANPGDTIDLEKFGNPRVMLQFIVYILDSDKDKKGIDIEFEPVEQEEFSGFECESVSSEAEFEVNNDVIEVVQGVEVVEDEEEEQEVINEKVNEGVKEGPIIDDSDIEGEDYDEDELDEESESSSSESESESDSPSEEHLSEKESDKCQVPHKEPEKPEPSNKESDKCEIPKDGSTVQKCIGTYVGGDSHEYKGGLSLDEYFIQQKKHAWLSYFKDDYMDDEYWNSILKDFSDDEDDLPNDICSENFSCSEASDDDYDGDSDEVLEYSEDEDEDDEEQGVEEEQDEEDEEDIEDDEIYYSIKSETRVKSVFKEIGKGLVYALLTTLALGIYGSYSSK